MGMIEVENLVKIFRQAQKRPGITGALRDLFAPERRLVRAVDDISLQIQRGEIVGYLGPNGAGKSTTIKMLTGILHPTTGSVQIAGLSPHLHRRQVVQNIGAVFGQRTQLNWELRLGESFELIRRIYQVDHRAYRDILDWMSLPLKLSEIINVPVRQLSLGQRMRAEIAAAIIHRPPVLLLDEPTIGLDIDAKNAVRQFVLELNRIHRTTVLLTTHDLGDVEYLCQRLIVINHGRIIEDGPLDHLIDRLSTHRILIVDCQTPPAGALNIPHVKQIKAEGLRVWLEFERKHITAAQLIAIVSQQWAIRDLSITEPGIEDVIQQVYGQKAPQA